MKYILSVLCLALFFSACSAAPASSLPESSSSITHTQIPEAPPEISIEASGAELPYQLRQENWNGSISCGEDLIYLLVKKDGIAALPQLQPGENIVLTFPEEFAPDSLRVLAEPRGENGRPVPGEEFMANADFIQDNNVYTITLPEFAESTGVLTGFLVEAVWGENNALYGFAAALPQE